MERTLAQIEQEHARLQMILNATPADKTSARKHIMEDMRKLEIEHKQMKRRKSGSNFLIQLVVGAVAVILISFVVFYIAGSYI